MVLSFYRKHTNNMRNKHTKTKRKIYLSRQTALFAVIILVLGSVVGTPIIKAENFTQQILKLQAENATKQDQVGVLKVEADGLEATVNAMQIQINGIQNQISDNQNKSVDLENQITAAQAELDQQKKVLGFNIKAMYLEGDISTIEMLATSKDLSDYFDKQQYRNTVKDKIKATLDRVGTLKVQLKNQQEKLINLIAEQQTLKSQVIAQKGEQDRLLNLNSDQRGSLDNQMRSNYAQITELRRQQAAAIARLAGNNGTSAVGSPIVYRNLANGGRCGGGYPYCDYDLDEWVSDPWNLSYARECVHYVAWAATQRGATIPNLSGRGNAYQWSGALSGVATMDNNPNGAMLVYLPVAPLGHVAMVEYVTNDGWVHISQYNWMWPGNYSEMDLKVTSNLLFFHF